MEIVNIKVKDLKPYEKNAKKHNQEQIDNVAKSIEKYGFVQPLVVDKDNVVIIGHCRLEASKKLKLKEVPCVMADTLTDEQVKELRLLDNKLNESDWDFDLLSEELADLDMSDFEIDWGIEELEPEKEVKEDDFDVESAIPEKPKAKYGDVYILGSHRLVCGDSTKEEDVAKLMDGELADLVVTDPPYNVDYVGKTEEALTIQNDNMEADKFFLLLKNAFANMVLQMKDGCVFYVWFNTREHINFENALRINNLSTRQELVWNKNFMVMGRQDYQQKHEPCLYGWKDGASHYFVDDRTQTTVIEDKGIDLKKLKKDEMLKLLQDIYSDKVSTTIINENRPSRSVLHPTMKPIKLLARLIKNSSRKEESVLDLFGGSGSTLIACEQLGRKCYMMELDPKYVDVIIKRWEDFTGKKAVKL